MTHSKDIEEELDKIAEILCFDKVGKKRVKYVCYNDDEVSTHEVDRTDTVMEMHNYISTAEKKAYEKGFKFARNHPDFEVTTLTKKTTISGELEEAGE